MIDQTSNAAKAQHIADEVESGGREATGFAGKFILAIAITWSIFQIYIASSIPYQLTEWLGVNLVVSGHQARIYHLAFAFALAMLSYPLFKSSPRDRVPVYDWVLMILAVSSCLYLLINKNDIAGRAGLPTPADLTISAIGMVCLGIAVYRTLGLPLLIVMSSFLLYVFFGDAQALPDVVQWKGASLSKALWHFWMQTEGVFGVALGVSASMIFLFVLFGSLLERAGAGNYFIKLSFALLGHLRGGPAKAAVVSSALSGLYSGSSIANVVTTGTFTIPLMKRTGFSAEKAGAIEVASSTNGQLTPPVMGAAAFLISEFTGVSYHALIKHAFLPAIISYIALIYIVHLEALKLDLKGMQKPPVRMTLAARAAGVLGGFIIMAVLFVGLYFLLSAVKLAFPGLTFSMAAVLFLGAYSLLINIAAGRADLDDDPDASITVLPRVWDVASTGLYYLLPIVILIWCILIERLSPTLSAFWATMAMIFIVLTQKPIKTLLRKTGSMANAWRDGFDDIVHGLIGGARNMTPIGIATGAAGIIIGTVSLTGAHQVVGEFVELLSGGSLIIMLLLVAVMSLLLGMGLPTTANYIVVSSLMAPVIVSVGAQQGLIVPLVAVHLFVFYFGILADDTPPVGLAAFAAAAISKGDPIKTGVQGFTYDIRTALLPFLFIFNTELLLIDVTPTKAVFVFIIATIAMMLFAAATQRYLLTRSTAIETLILLMVSLTLFRPGFWLDRVDPPFNNIDGGQIVEQVQKHQNEDLRLVIEGPDFDNPDKESSITLIVKLGEGADSQKVLYDAGLIVDMDNGIAKLEEPLPGTPFFSALQQFDFYMDEPVKIASIQEKRQRINKEVFYIPAFLLLALVVWLQRRRVHKNEQAVSA